LQKSTSGAWRRALASDEFAKAAVSSLPFAEGEEASEARPGWQSPRVRVAGSRPRCRESGAERALVGGRHPEPGKSSSLTRRRWKRFWSHPEGVSALEGWGDMGCQRVIRTPRSRLKTPWRRCAARGTFDRRNHQERAALETRTARSGSPHRKAREDRARVIRSCRRNVNCAFTRVVRWGLGSVVRDRCARACRSPRESNVRQVLVSRIGCRSR
jgi:hypothetical protein